MQTGKETAAKGTCGSPGWRRADAQAHTELWKSTPYPAALLHPHARFHLTWARHKPQCPQNPPATSRHTLKKKYKAQHHSPLPLNHSPPRNRLTLTKAGVILLTDQFPINSSKKGVSVEPGNPRSWRKTSRISAERLQLCSPLLLRLQLKSRVDHI